MVAKGQQQVYYGVRSSKPKKVEFDDGVTFISIRKLSDGEHNDYISKTFRRITTNKPDGTSTTEPAMGAGDAQKLLYELVVCDWNLIDADKDPVKLIPTNIRNFFQDLEDENLVKKINEAILEQNPWLELTDNLENLRKAKVDLEKRIAKLEEEEAKNSS